MQQKYNNISSPPNYRFFLTHRRDTFVTLKKNRTFAVVNA
jgi:hypothetical protein